MPLLLAENLVKTYRLPGAAPIRILDGAALSVEPGERVAVLGKSGSGKSTLLNLLGGLDRPDRGCRARIEIAGRDLARASEKAKARVRAETIGFVFQSFHLLPELDIVENVALPTLALPASRRPPRDRAVALLRAAGLGERLGHKPRELSGGEQQRVAICRALANGPALLLADEPTGNLDPATGLQVLDLLFGLAGADDDAAGAPRPALVMVTHSDAVAARCDRVLRLEGGLLRPDPART